MWNLCCVHKHMCIYTIIFYMYTYIYIICICIVVYAAIASRWRGLWNIQFCPFTVVTTTDIRPDYFTKPRDAVCARNFYSDQPIQDGIALRAHETELDDPNIKTAASKVDSRLVCASIRTMQIFRFKDKRMRHNGSVNSACLYIKTRSITAINRPHCSLCILTCQRIF